MFSVIIPLYNKSNHILETINSVISQTYIDFEIVVVNDGSTDGGPDLIRSIKDDRVRLINQDNKGVSAARNRGISESRGEWIVFIDADDIWMSDHLYTLSELIKKYPCYSVFCTSYLKVDKKQIKNHILINDNSVTLYNKNIFFKESIKRKPLWTGVVAVKKREILKNNIYFDERLKRGEDLDYWIKLARLYTIVKSNKLTAFYVNDPFSLSKGYSNYSESIVSKVNLKGLSGFERIYFKRMVFSRIKSSFLRFRFKEFFFLLHKHNYQLFK